MVPRHGITNRVPIAESGSRYHNQYIFEGLKILATHPQRQSHFVRHSSWVVGLPQALRLPIDAAIGRLAIHYNKLLMFSVPR